MTPAIEVRGLRKSYGDTAAVRGIDFEVATGECVAILGPNGAGKTTTVEILEGFRTADAGDVLVLGRDPSKGERTLREKVGIVLQTCGVEPFLTVRELVTLHAGYYPAPKSVDDVLDIVGIANKADSRVKTLSGGQQRRVDMALGLIGDPELIFLDEPTTGFDPAARREAWEAIDRLRELGKTVLLTTHYMDEAQHLADRVILFVSGEIAAQGTPETLGGADAAETTVSFVAPTVVDRGDMTLPSNAVVVESLQGTNVSFTTHDATRDVHHITSWAISHEVVLERLTVTQPSLEDIYLQLTAPDDKP